MYILTIFSWKLSISRVYFYISKLDFTAPYVLRHLPNNNLYPFDAVMEIWSLHLTQSWINESQTAHSEVHTNSEQLAACCSSAQGTGKSSITSPKPQPVGHGCPMSVFVQYLLNILKNLPNLADLHYQNIQGHIGSKVEFQWCHTWNSVQSA